MISLIEFNLSALKFNLSARAYRRCLIYEKGCTIPKSCVGFMWVGIKGDWRDLTDKEIIYYCLESLYSYIEQLIGEYTI